MDSFSYYFAQLVNDTFKSFFFFVGGEEVCLGTMTLMHGLVKQR